MRRGSEIVAEELDEPKTAVVEYQTATMRASHNALATLAFAASLICIAEVVVVPARVGDGDIGFWIVIVGAITAIVAGILGVRFAEKNDRGGKARAWFGLILGGIFLGLWLWGIANVAIYGDRRERENRVSCQFHMRMIGQGLMLYASEHGGQFPKQFAQLISDADINPEIFNCPATPDQKAVGQNMQQILADFGKPGHCSYIYLGAGMSTSTVTKDSVLAYEPLEHHEGTGAHFVFGDFRAEWRNAKEARKMIDQLKSGVNPPKQ
jgi:hypothetical protein